MIESVKRIVLISCVKSKLTHPGPAKDLYKSPLFTKARRYAERSGNRWFILSAEHGLVAPDEWLAPYERYLADTPAEYQSAWGAWVAARLDLLAGPLTGSIIEVHAGATYVNVIRSHLESSGAQIVDPLHGLQLGHRLSWYGEQDQAEEANTGDEQEVVSEMLLKLRDSASAASPASFVAIGKASVDRRGLYSWWVDEAGAGDLSRGLGFPVAAGLIYAGLAGATRWPSGRPSNNTLWLRITTMHLAGNHEFSTFRRTLGSILAASVGSTVIDEAALTKWMGEHLRVVAVPYDDGDVLGRLERAVLQELDPPLNLQGMESTPIRRQLKLLRRAVVNPPGSAAAES